MIKPSFCFVLILFSFLHVAAQKKKINARVSASNKEVKVNVIYSYDRESKDHSLGNVAPVLMMKTKHDHFHEVELNTLNLDSYTDSYNDPWGNPIEADVHEFNSGIRYQFSYKLLKGERILNPFIGLSALSLYTSLMNTPKVDYAYPRKTRLFNEIVSIVPHVRYAISDRVFMNVDLPLQVMRFEYFFQEIKNPAIPIRQQSNSGVETDFSFMPVFHIRLGLGVRL